ncbi:MAG TPA: hypothetical protein VJA21_30360, partial [Verrucomicrobiae bacterium]
MNRSILIVICDFLLVSLLAFSTVDINKVSDEGTPRNVKIDFATNQVESGKDLAAVMRLALDEERRTRDQLMGELTRARETATRQQSVLSDRDKQVQTFQQELQARDQQAQRLQQELQTRDQQAQNLQRDLQSREQQLQNSQKELRAREQQAQRLQQAQAGLEQQYAAAQINIANLNQQVQSSATESLLS